MVEHKWELCSMCGPMIVCGTCGNNSCNGGMGHLPDGKECPDCESSWKLHDTFVETPEGKVWSKHAANIFEESSSYRRYVDQIEWFLHRYDPETLKAMWKWFGEEEPELRPKLSHENEKYMNSETYKKLHSETKDKS